MNDAAYSQCKGNCVLAGNDREAADRSTVAAAVLTAEWRLRGWDREQKVSAWLLHCEHRNMALQMALCCRLRSMHDSMPEQHARAMTARPHSCRLHMEPQSHLAPMGNSLACVEV